MVEGPVARIFVAVPLPDEVRMALTDGLDGVQLPGRVIPAENWHITLRFLGRTDEVAYDRLLGAMDGSDLGSTFDLGLGELGAFPRARNATVLWLAVTNGGERLDDLAAEVEEASQTAGFPPEDRPFRPHLTLSRIRPAEDVNALIDGFSGVGTVWRCRSVVVYRSHSGRGGARYEALETFPLTGKSP
ncbi:MAG: RNA 2',3'-cyclic phosphodiesterase [Acidimicrobiia bacterium]